MIRFTGKKNCNDIVVGICIKYIGTYLLLRPRFGVLRQFNNISTMRNDRTRRVFNCNIFGLYETNSQI